MRGSFRLTKFSVSISYSALKDLNSLDNRIKKRIKFSLKGLEEDPFRRRAKADIKKLRGLKNPDLYRLRVGDYRIVYVIAKKKVKITHILKRSKVYEGLE